MIIIFGVAHNTLKLRGERLSPLSNEICIKEMKKNMRVEQMDEDKINKEYKKLNEQKDKAFKDNVRVKGFSENVSKIKNIGKFYNPDKILENEDSIIFFESSSTSDRKVHIGELIQFLTFVSHGIENRNIYFVLFLCGTAKYPPKVDKELDRLRYYYKNFSMKNSECAKIKGIYLENQLEIDIRNLTLEKIKKFKRIDKVD